VSKFIKSNATIDTRKLKPTRGNWKVHNEINSLGSSIYGKMEMFCPVDLVSENWKEVLKFIWSGFGLPFHVEEDVGLGLYHSLLVGQSYSTVVEMEPTAFMSCVCGVMSRAHAVTGGGKRKDNQKETDHLALWCLFCQG